MLCKLCQLEKAIENSHIIPQFISSWIKETSPLGGLRNVDQPNLRQEDTVKTPLLCSSCEKHFGFREHQFAEKIFFPFNDEGNLDFTYSDWLLYFVVSLNWRVGVSLLDDKQKKKLENRMKTAPPIWEIRQARSKHKGI